jgi:hypothetical protein
MTTINQINASHDVPGVRVHSRALGVKDRGATTVVLFETSDAGRVARARDRWSCVLVGNCIVISHEATEKVKFQLLLNASVYGIIYGTRKLKTSKT